MRRPLVLLIALCALVATTTSASAWWSAASSPGGGGAAVGATVNQGATPTATAAGGRNVTVAWGASSLSGGPAVDGYLIKRYDAGSGVAQTVGAGCTGTRTGTACTEAGVPPGEWKYTVTPVVGVNWRGAESLLSGAVTIGPATLTLDDTLFGAPLPQSTTGSLVGFATNEAIAYRLDASTPLAGSPSRANLLGAAAITSLTIPSAAEGPHTVFAVGDAFLAPSRASAGIVIDTIAPTAAAQLAPAPDAGGWSTSPVELTLGATDESGSGIARIAYTTDGSDPISSGTAQTYAAPLTLATSATVKYAAVDVAGNASTIQTQPVRIDTVAPVGTVTVSDAGGATSRTANTVYYRGSIAGSFTLINAVTDAGSGAASSATGALTGTSTGWSHTPSTVTSPTGGPYVSNAFAWTAGTTTAPTVTVTARDAAGKTAATTLTFANDSTAPAGGSVAYTNGAINVLGVPVTTADGTDGGSGLNLASRVLKRDETTLVGGTCGSFPGTFAATVTLSGGYDVGVVSGKCYQYRYLVYDQVGNLATYTSPSVAQVDTTPPAATSCYSSQVTADSPVGYWRLNESSGTVAADSAGANPGSFVGGTTLGQAGALAATSNKAVSVNGSTGRINVPDANSLDVNAFTVEAWVRPTSWGTTGNYRTIVMKGGAFTERNFGMWLEGGTNGKIHYSFGTAAGGVASYTSNTELRLNVWQHIAFVHVAGTKSQLYINGVLDSDYATALTPATSSAPISIGGPPSTYDSFAGGIDEVAVYNTSLSATRLRAHYNAGRCYRDETLSDSPMAYWRLGEAPGTGTAFDFNGANNALFENGAILGAAGLIDGDTDTAVDFDGVNDRVRSLPGALDVSSDFSLEATIKATSGSGVRKIVGNQEYALYLTPRDGPADMRFEVRDSTTGNRREVVAPLSVAPGASVHIVGVKDGPTLRLYKNGVEIATAPAPAALASAPQTTYIGSDIANGYFQGRIDDVSVVGSALSAARVRAHYYTSRAYRDVVFDRAPASYWRFGESSGTSAADETGAAPGTYASGNTLGGGGAIAGDASTAVTLNGSTGHLALPTGIVSSYTLRFTFEGWIYWRGGGAWQRIFDFGMGPSSFLMLSANGGAGTLTFSATNPVANGFGLTTSTSLPTNAWHHVAATLDGSHARVYLNGALIGSMPTAFVPSLMGPTGSNYFGRSQFIADSYLNATIDDFAIYKTALTANELQAHYEAGRDAPR